MSRHLKLLLLLLVCLALAGAGVKAVRAIGPMEGQVHDSGTIIFEQSLLALTEKGMRLLHRGAFTRDAGYEGGLLAHPSCEGWLALIPLRRNAEGAALGRLLPGSERQEHFVSNSGISETFPATSYFLDSFMAQITQGPKPVVMAVIEQGQCGLSPQALTVLSSQFQMVSQIGTIH